MLENIWIVNIWAMLTFWKPLASSVEHVILLNIINQQKLSLNVAVLLWHH